MRARTTPPHAHTREARPDAPPPPAAGRSQMRPQCLCAHLASEGARALLRARACGGRGGEGARALFLTCEVRSRQLLRSACVSAAKGFAGSSAARAAGDEADQKLTERIESVKPGVGRLYRCRHVHAESGVKAR